jgi:DNA sulfur modification protein DndB
MKSRLLFPAIRCRIGEWIYYVTYLKFSDVAEWIKPTDEVHNSKKLAGWIQRRLDGQHTKAIVDYLITQPERFFNSIVVGIYGGTPIWAPLKVSVPNNIDFDQISDEQELELESSIGLLKFSGNEILFAIDGQHRVAGIKKALKESKDLGREELCAVFVGHENTPEGIERTRRLFTTLNKTAKKVALADIVALDEDDGFAVVARQLIDDFELFAQGKRVVFASSPMIPLSDKTSITSVIGIYQLIQDIYPQKPREGFPKKSEVLRARPSDDILKTIYDENCQYWILLKELIPEYSVVFANDEVAPGEYRSKEQNHLLFRYVGQRAFASAIQVLMSRGQSMRSSVERLRGANLWLHTKEWRYILWNPLQERMIPRNRVVAETFLLQQIGEEGKSTKNEQRLKELIMSRDQQT